jgi:rSAM/selenodomain-associated transferase 1
MAQIYNLSQAPGRTVENALIVIAKRPSPGDTKTRLSPPLTPRQASELYECFLLDTLDVVRQVPDIQPAIAYLPARERPYFASLAPDFELILQEGADLGSRLDHALTAYLQRGYRRVAIMDSDSPTLPAACLVETFDTLANGANLAIGPCEDGGYYLIGVTQPEPRLLREVKMSTSHVTADTLALAAEEGRQVALTPSWYDVDDSASLARLLQELKHAPQTIARRTRAYLNRSTFGELAEATQAGPD